MRERLRGVIEAYIAAYCAQQGKEPVWRTPLIGFADAADAGFLSLRASACADHLMPDDVLPGARSVISYFLPFSKALLGSNVGSVLASDAWAEAYLLTNAMAAALNEHLIRYLDAIGFRAAAPNASFDPQRLLSRWSQRHVAYLAGLGSFGLNNMLIGPSGCGGRYFSIVTDMPLPADPRAPQRCLYKQNGTCALCARRCPANALLETHFDRARCYAQCHINQQRTPGAEVCGKCVVGLPCTGG